MTLAALAPLVFEAADAGDAVAADIVTDGAEHLAVAVAAAARQLGLERSPLPLALAGGVLLATSSYRDKVRSALVSLDLDAKPITLVGEPAEGAVRLALGKLT
jgi:N-acetylglucosamine kinase-like BadF-type ATPase